MEIHGLLFDKINEDWNRFNNNLEKISLANAVELTNEEKVELFEKNLLRDSLKKVLDHHPKLIEINLKNQSIISENLQLSFSHFFAYLFCAGTVYENLRKYLNKNKTVDSYKLIIPLYGKLIRLAEQIGVMLTNGYPDGAWRIWRSFYEDTVVLLFLIKERSKSDLESKYIDHFNRSKKKKAESMQKNHEALKFPSIESKIMEDLNERIGKISSIYGKEFLDDEYGWANSSFNISRKITLRDIEERVGMNRYRPFYIWASEYSHATFGSMIQFLDDNKISLSSVIRQSTKKSSFIDPMQFTISLFHEINVEFIKLYSELSEYEINMLMFRRIFEGMIESFG